MHSFRVSSISLYLEANRGSMTKQIPLTQGQVTTVSDHRFDYLNQWSWIAVWSKFTQSYYAARWEGKGIFRKKIYMARVIANTPDGMLCDHINHNTLDNTDSNLRNVTKLQNNINRGAQRNNKTGVAGVFVRGDSGKYRARLKFGGKCVLDKTFPILEQAIQARKEAEEKYFEEFAYVGDNQ